MGKGHFVSTTPDEFDWEGFRKHVGYSKEELNALRNDAVRSAFVQQICSPAMQDKYLVMEIVESHGCVAGMKPGDRLYFKGMSVLDTARSDPWCPYIANTHMFTGGARAFFVEGLEPDGFYVKHSGCFDVGPEHGLGRVVYKVFVIDGKEINGPKGT